MGSDIRYIAKQISDGFHWLRFRGNAVARSLKLTWRWRQHAAPLTAVLIRHRQGVTPYKTENFVSNTVTSLNLAQKAFSTGISLEPFRILNMATAVYVPREAVQSITWRHWHFSCVYWTLKPVSYLQTTKTSNILSNIPASRAVGKNRMAPFLSLLYSITQKIAHQVVEGSAIRELFGKWKSFQ